MTTSTPAPVRIGEVYRSATSSPFVRRHATAAPLFVLGFLTFAPALFSALADECQADVTRIASLPRAQQPADLRLVLEHCSYFPDLMRWIFADEALLRPGLLALVDEPRTGVQARRLLSVIGDRRDITVLMRPPVERTGPFQNRWAY